MARKTDDTPKPEAVDTETTEAPKPKPARARRTRKPPAAKEAVAAPKDVKRDDAAVVVEGKDIRNDGTETILESLETDAGEQTEVVTSLESTETVVFEDMGEMDPAPGLGDAGMILDMLNGLAESGAPEAGEPDSGSPVWLILSRQVEDTQRKAAKRRKAGSSAKKLDRQVRKAAAFLNDLCECAVTDASVFSHDRAIGRLVALMEVTPPKDKPSQKVLADIIRTERRALARAVKGK